MQVLDQFNSYLPQNKFRLVEKRVCKGAGRNKVPGGTPYSRLVGMIVVFLGVEIGRLVNPLKSTSWSFLGCERS